MIEHVLDGAGEASSLDLCVWVFHDYVHHGVKLVYAFLFRDLRDGFALILFDLAYSDYFSPCPVGVDVGVEAVIFTSPDLFLYLLSELVHSEGFCELFP